LNAAGATYCGGAWSWPVKKKVCPFYFSSVGGLAATYDDAGNLTQYNGYVYEYDAENRLTVISDTTNLLIATFTYDALGRRVQQDEYGDVDEDRGVISTIRYYYDGWPGADGNHAWGASTHLL